MSSNQRIRSRDEIRGSNLSSMTISDLVRWLFIGVSSLAVLGMLLDWNVYNPSVISGAIVHVVFMGIRFRTIERRALPRCLPYFIHKSYNYIINLVLDVSFMFVVGSYLLEIENQRTIVNPSSQDVSEDY